MNKFKVGDRVAVYSALGGRKTGVINMKHSDDSMSVLRVNYDEKPAPHFSYSWVHSKQCRKLVKKKQYKNYASVTLEKMVACCYDAGERLETIEKRLDRLEEKFSPQPMISCCRCGEMDSLLLKVDNKHILCGSCYFKDTKTND